MPARSATVILDANIGPYTAKMTRAAAVGATTGKAIDASMTRATGGAARLGQATGALPGKFGALASVGGLAFAGVGLAGAGAAKTFADFDKAMDGVGASTGATEAELVQLGETAIKVAADTKFSAIEAAAGIEALGKAGISTADIIGGALKGAMDLAAAGEIEVAEAAELAAGAMTQFGLSGRDVPHIADLMAAGAGKAQGNVEDMAMAFKQGGLVASQMGLSLEDTTGTLAAFASNALIGSDAGTSLRTMLLRLMNPSGEAADLMQQLGINAYSATGQFVGMESLAGQLQLRLKGLSQEQRDAALATIFGSDAIRAANVLYKEGSEGIGTWIDKVNDAGFAEEQAAQRTDNLAGDMERLGGAIQEMGITAGEAANNPLRWLVQRLEELVEVSNEAMGAEDKITSSTIGTARGFETLADATDEEAEATERARVEAEIMGTALLQDEAAALRYESGLDAAATQSSALLDEMEKVTQAAFDQSEQFLTTRDAARGWEQALDDAETALGKNGETLDITTEKGRANEEALDDMAGAALRLLEQQNETGDVTEKSMEQMRTALFNTGRRFGMTEEQAHSYAEEVISAGLLRINTPVVVSDAAARAKVAAWNKLIATSGGKITVSITAIERASGTGGKGFTAGFPLPGGRSAYKVSQGPHDGGAIDYAAPRGTAIFASYSGQLDVSDLGNRSYGKYYTLTSGNRRELGAHLQGFAHGDGHVSQGQLIGWVDSTGNSTGSHLHLLRNFDKGGAIGGPYGASVPINAHGGEYIVNAAATARNRGALEAMNSGRGGGGVTLINHGVIGSRIELENWLTRGVDTLRRQGRL